MYKILTSLIATCLFALILTPLVRRLSFKIGAVDDPNARRVNRVPMPHKHSISTDCRVELFT